MIATCFILAFVAFAGAMYMVSDHSGWKNLLPDQKMTQAWAGIGLLSLSGASLVLGVILWLWA